MAVCFISFLTRAGMCAPGRGTSSTRLCRYVRAVPRSIHTPVPVCVRKCCTPSTRLCRYGRARPHSIHTLVPVCVRKCGTPSTRLCRYVRTRPRNIHTPVPVCVRKCCTPFTRLCRYVRAVAYLGRFLVCWSELLFDVFFHRGMGAYIPGQACVCCAALRAHTGTGV